MKQPVVYKTITFLNGDKCDVLMCSYGDVSRAMEKYNKQPKFNEDGSVYEALDVSTFLTEQICLFNGQKKDIDFLCKLSCDFFYQINAVINELLNVMK